MRPVPVLIALVAVILVALLGLLAFLILPGGGVGTQQPLAGGGAVDSEARIELELMRGDIENLQIALADLEARLRAAEAAGGGDALANAEEILNQGPNDLLHAYAQVVEVADRRNINQGLFVATPSYLIEKLGMPRPDLNDNCQRMTNPRLADQLIKDQVGPIRVEMLKPAADSLARVFTKIRETDRDLYDRINTAGSLCVRRIRGSTNSVSTHAFGLAVDINIDGHLDTLGDGKTQVGLNIIYEFFNAEGWVWGAAFSREDSMHFEVSRKKLDDWIAEGKL